MPYGSESDDVLANLQSVLPLTGGWDDVIQNDATLFRTALRQSERVLAVRLAKDLDTSPLTLFTVPAGLDALVTKVIFDNPSSSVSSLTGSLGTNAGVNDNWRSSFSLANLDTDGFLVVQPTYESGGVPQKILRFDATEVFNGRKASGSSPGTCDIYVMGLIVPE